MDVSFMEKKRFVEDLWVNICAQLQHRDIVEISTDNFNLLGEDGERFIANHMALNSIVEFFSDTTNNDRIYLANPLSVVQGMNFTIITTGARLRALVPIPITPNFQIDQEYSCLTYDMGCGLIDPRLMASEEPQPAPNAGCFDVSQYTTYYTQPWAPVPGVQLPALDMFQQVMELTSSPEIVSPTPMRVSYDTPAVHSGQFNTAAQNIAFQAGLERNSLESNPLQIDRQAQPPAKAYVNIQPAPRKEPPAKKEKKIPRPPNAFILFRRAHWREVKEREGDGIQNWQISTKLGEMWHGMSEEEQQPWRDQQQVAADEHKRLYPDYKYKPRKKGTKKTKGKKVKKSHS
ncbi:hypothetical protein F5Y09DRAFT_354608 [Xylaria sp. FL1042]|nr:hypothetical protein F5Y09DRAFT_354608 [Xylaria sp. FL1042]